VRIVLSYTKIIQEKKQEYGSRLAILGHHYQSDAIIQHVDISGDSLELARNIGSLSAEHIVFCGVWFMAESAAILKAKGQKVHVPDVTASCAMADMATAMTVKKVLKVLRGEGRNIVPLTYVNSSLGVKSVVGEFGGAVCTSANAKTMMEWARSQGDGVLFLPDMHLGNNTANTLGIPTYKRTLIDLAMPKADSETELYLWPGYCPVHDMYMVQDVENIRKNDPNALVVVHPEAPPAVVDACDAGGSTSFIIKYVADAPEGSTIYVGTEMNLVTRLARQYEGKKTIRHLDMTYCEDMAKITEEKLAHLLQHLETAVPVEADEVIAAPAKAALQRMLDACA